MNSNAMLEVEVAWSEKEVQCREVRECQAESNHVKLSSLNSRCQEQVSHGDFVIFTSSSLVSCHICILYKLILHCSRTEISLPRVLILVSKQPHQPHPRSHLQRLLRAQRNRKRTLPLQHRQSP